MVGSVIAALRVAWPIVVGVAIFMALGRYGFNPTDEGFVNAAANRVLHGGIPHRDFIWAKPAGSAYIHAPELLLPTPGLLTSRAIALSEIVLYSLLLVGLLTRRWPWRWGLAEVGVGVVAILLNLHTMPLMVWQTVDGILLVAAGAVLLQAGLERDRLPLLAVAFLLFGAAATTKQSFWPAPIFGLVWLLGASASGTRLSRAGVAVGAAALIPAIYVGMVGVAGGLDEMLVQLGGAEPVIGIELVTQVVDPVLAASLVVLMGVVTWLAPATGSRPVARAALPILVATVVAGVVVRMGLGFDGAWAIVLWWLVVVTAIVRSVRDRRVDWPGLVLIGLGWMVSLSYGPASPALVAGSLAAYLVLRTTQDVASDAAGAHAARASMLAAAGAAILLLVVIVPTFVSERRTDVYRDRPVWELTSSLGNVDDDFAGIRTTAVTASYMTELAECVRAHPATQVAVLPDNPVIYPYLDLENPFPADWIIPLDTIGSEQRFVEAAAELDRRGDYLVVFQPLDARQLRRVEALEPVPEGPFRDPELGAEIRAQLTGQVVACGSFEGVWKP